MPETIFNVNLLEFSLDNESHFYMKTGFKALFGLILAHFFEHERE